MAGRGVYLIVAASLLMMLQCCNHVCVCEENGDSEDDDDLWLEVEEEEEEGVSVFEPTREWKTVNEGQAIPAGLHVRMNLETGKKEARLMEDDATTAGDSKKDKTSQTENGVPETPQTDQQQQETVTPPADSKTQTDPKQQNTGDSGGRPSSGFVFKGDQRRARHYGHSDRRGIINKRRRMFTQRDVASALRKIDQTNKRAPGRIANLPSQSPNQQPEAAPSSSNQGVRVVQQEKKEGGKLEKPLHRELAEMLRLTKTLTRRSATVPELLGALEELEYHVHHIENARELNSIGGLVVVVRLLNHTHPEVKSSAAHVIGSATQRYKDTILTLFFTCAFLHAHHTAILRCRVMCWTTEGCSCCVSS